MRQYTRFHKIIAATILILLVGCSGWSKEAKVAYGVMWAAQTVDYAQTISVAGDNDDGLYGEGNGMTSLSQPRLVEYIIVSNLAILGVSCFIPDDWRIWLFYFKAGTNTMNAIHNKNIISRVESERKFYNE